MGFQDFMDAVLGRSRLPKAKSDKLFEISTACITLESNFGLKPSGYAGICFKPIDTSAYESTRKEIQELLEYSSKDKETKFRIEKDKYNFLWAIFKDSDFEDIVANIYLVSQTLEERGLGEQILCAIYRFDREYVGLTAYSEENTDRLKAVYWIYNFKQGNYYPFIPLPGRQRDSPFEFRLRANMEKELSIEKNIEKWYPLWEIPF